MPTPSGLSIRSCATYALYVLLVVVVQGCDNRPKYVHDLQAFRDEPEVERRLKIVSKYVDLESYEDVSGFRSVLNQCTDELLMVEGIWVALPNDFDWGSIPCSCLDSTVPRGHLSLGLWDNNQALSCTPQIDLEIYRKKALREGAALTGLSRSGSFVSNTSSSENASALDEVVVGPPPGKRLDAREFYDLIERCVSTYIQDSQKVQTITERDLARQSKIEECQGTKKRDQDSKVEKKQLEEERERQNRIRKYEELISDGGN